MFIQSPDLKLYSGPALNSSGEEMQIDGMIPSQRISSL
jgi:hypothetical protein